MRRRFAGIFLAVVLEVALLLALLSLGISSQPDQPKPVAMVSFDAREDQEDKPPQPEDQQPTPEKPRAASVQQPQPVPAPVQAPSEVAPAPPMPALIPLSKEKMASADISNQKLPPIKAVIKGPQGPQGPPDTGSAGDSQRVSGSGPNGEPLYAASWYREPYPEELSGYLSTASGPGWALINCQTVGDFRVDHCVLDGEYPPGSNMGRAVLAAAWQFRVRPPRVGGKSKVGEWVRIRITYEMTRK